MKTLDRIVSKVEELIAVIGLGGRSSGMISTRSRVAM